MLHFTVKEIIRSNSNRNSDEIVESPKKYALLESQDCDKIVTCDRVPPFNTAEILTYPTNDNLWDLVKTLILNYPIFNINPTSIK